MCMCAYLGDQFAWGFGLLGTRMCVFFLGSTLLELTGGIESTVIMHSSPLTFDPDFAFVAECIIVAFSIVKLLFLMICSLSGLCDFDS